MSIVVPARNEAGTIEACVQALLGQDYPVDCLEVLVVDGLSDDGTPHLVQAIAQHDPRVRLISNPERVTPTAFNHGIRRSRGDIVGVMSAHGVPSPDYVSRAIQSLQVTDAWCVGGRIRRVAATPTQQAIATATSSPFGVGDATHNYRATSGWVETAFPGLWPRWVFERVGLFDPELVRNQDDELSFRIREAGGGIWFEPQIVVDYVPRGSYRALFSQYRQYAMWKVRVFQKHPAAARPRHVVPAAWVAATVGGMVVAPTNAGALVLTIGAVTSYSAVMIVAARRLGSPGTRVWDVFRALVTLHVAYGVGFWQGLVRFAPRWVRDRRGAREALQARDA